MRMLILVVGISLLFPGCAAKRAYVKNPATGEVKECYATVAYDWFPTIAIRKCVEKYKQAGWVEIK